MSGNSVSVRCGKTVTTERQCTITVQCFEHCVDSDSVLSCDRYVIKCVDYLKTGHKYGVSQNHSRYSIRILIHRVTMK